MTFRQKKKKNVKNDIETEESLTVHCQKDPLHYFLVYKRITFLIDYKTTFVRSAWV